MRRKKSYSRKSQIAAVILLALILGASGWLQNRHTGMNTPKLPSPSLKALAKKHNITVGNFAILNRLNEKPYQDILTSQFDFTTIDNIPNWHFTSHDLRPTPTTYDFSQIDQVVNFSKEHNMPMQAHHFTWGEQKWLPDWLIKGNYTSEQLLDLIHQHIQTVGAHYSGTIGQWTVVNEAFTRKQHIFGLHDWWADHAGEAYIDQSFIWAREADPHATLILNDFNNESINTTSNNMYDYLKAAKARGVPIDGIGMQMHIDGVHPPVKDEVIENMKRFGDLGIKVYVTEFDVNMNDVQATDADKDKLEANIYYEMARACIESKVCPSFALLGITDKETWYNYLGNTPDARPLPFDKNYRPKPAFYSLREAFAEP